MAAADANADRGGDAYPATAGAIGEAGGGAPSRIDLPGGYVAERGEHPDRWMVVGPDGCAAGLLTMGERDLRALAAPAGAGVAVPAGYVLVPFEPTSEMIEAAYDAVTVDDAWLIDDGNRWAQMAAWKKRTSSPFGPSPTRSRPSTPAPPHPLRRARG